MNTNGQTKPVQTQHSANLSPSRPGRLLRLPAVMERCGLGRSTIYAGVKNGTFPAPVRLSARAIAWREEDTDQWVSERVTTGGQS